VLDLEPIKPIVTKYLLGHGKLGLWSLFEVIDTGVKLAYMIGISGIDEPRRLFHVDRLSKKTL